MKGVWLATAMLFAALLLVPLFALDNGDFKKPLSEPITGIQQSSGESSTAQPQPQKTVEKFRVLNSATGEVTEMTAVDYIRGVVAAEMPALYEDEALKAQAVAAYTFAYRRKSEANGRDYDISTNSATDQSFMPDTDAQQKWGDNADTYLAKIRAAVEAVSGYLVTYNGAAALTVYHAISSGRTESSADVWGSEYPYLTPVDSVGDKLSPKYLTTAVFTTEELSAALKSLCSTSGDESGWFSGCETTGSGRVKKLCVCGTELTGEQLRTALSLRSASFSVSFSEGSFTFTVCGYGHGVGMSQNGANYMAKQGSGFEEILCWYYPGCTVEKVC